MKKNRKLLWIPVVILAAALIGFLLWKTGAFSLLRDLDRFTDMLMRFAPYTQIIFFFVQLLSVIIAPIPSNITAMAGAVVLGWLQSFLLTVAAVYLGAFICFTIARKLGKQKMDQFISRKLSEKYRELIRTKCDTFLILAFLFPCFPDDLLCIMAGFTDISPKRFMAITVFTRPWGLLASSLVGEAFTSLPWGLLAVLIAVMLTLFVLGMIYGDKIEAAIIAWYRKKRGRDGSKEA